MPEVQPAADGLRVTGCAAQHPGDRPEQEDRVALLTSRAAPDCVLGVVADGVGGRTGGALAAQTAVEVSRRRFEAFVPAHIAPRTFFASLVAEINAALRRDAAATRLQPHTTFAAVLVQRGRVDWCHVGDTRVYHCRDGVLVHQTVDQTVELAADPSTATPARRFTTVLGVPVAPAPGFGGITAPDASDRFLVCSDGLWAQLADHEIARALAGAEPRRAAEAMIDTARARARGRGDNCSLLMLQLSACRPPRAASPMENAPGARSHAGAPALPTVAAGPPAARRAA